MNKSELLLEKMSVLVMKTPSGSTAKMLLTNKPLGADIPVKLLQFDSGGTIERTIQKIIDKNIKPDISYNLTNIFSRKQLQALRKNTNFSNFSKNLQRDIKNATLN